MQWCLLLATLTIVTPVCVPGVGNQPVGGVILLSPAQDLDGMTPQHLSSHMLVHTWQHRTEKVTPWESTTCQNSGATGSLVSDLFDGGTVGPLQPCVKAGWQTHVLIRLHPVEGEEEQAWALITYVGLHV